MCFEKLDKYIEMPEFLKITKSVLERKGLEVKVEAKCKTDKSQRNIAHQEEVTDIEFVQNDTTTYTIKQTVEFKHERGVGGYWRYESVLYKKNSKTKKVLESIKDTSWNTYSDDSLDQDSGRLEYTKLYSRGDLESDIFKKFI